MTKIHIYLDRVFKSVLIHTQVEEYILCRADHCLEGLYIDHPFYLDPKLLVLYISKQNYLWIYEKQQDKSSRICFSRHIDGVSLHVIFFLHFFFFQWNCITFLFSVCYLVSVVGGSCSLSDINRCMNQFFLDAGVDPNLVGKLGHIEHINVPILRKRCR